MQTENLAESARAWLSVIDGVLTSVEKTAWSVRAICDDVREAWDTTANTTAGAPRATRAEPSASSGLPDSGVVRLTRTGFALAQIAASYRVYQLRAAFMPARKAKRLLARLHDQNAKRFYATCVEHGGAFVKVGQVLSARADLLPKPFVTQLSQLQDAVPALPFETIRAALEQELKQPLNDAFSAFDPQPLAAASIGQVHRAVTLGGEQVAVKVQRPGIAKLVQADLGLLEMFLDGLRESLPPLDYDTITGELRGAVLAELDYFEEAHMTETLARAFDGDPNVLVPSVRRELSSASVLTTSFIEGRKLTVVLDELAARGEHAELSRLLGVLLAAYLKQILAFGAFQADPHPGNLLVTPEGKLAILDFGCSKTLLPEVRADYVALLRAFMMSERERMPELLAKVGFRTQSGKPDTLLTFADALLLEFQTALREGRFVWPEREQMMARATEMLRASQRDPVTRIPAEFVLIARVLGTLGGLFSHYRPEISFAEHVMPVLGGVFFETAQVP